MWAIGFCGRGITKNIGVHLNGINDASNSNTVDKLFFDTGLSRIGFASKVFKGIGRARHLSGNTDVLTLTQVDKLNV